MELEQYKLGYLAARAYIDRPKNRIVVPARSSELLSRLFNGKKPYKKPACFAYKHEWYELTIYDKSLLNEVLSVRVIPPQYVPSAHHFVRGYFDGKGWWNRYKVRFSGELSFLCEIAAKLPCKFCIVRKDPHHQLYVIGMDEVLKLGNWLYADANIYCHHLHRQFQVLRDTPYRTP